jgi:hypothetical protein
MTEESEFILKPSSDNTVDVMTVRRELDRIERLLDKHTPGMIAMIGMNLMLRQLHILHATVDASDRWLDAMAEAAKRALREKDHDQ